MEEQSPEVPKSEVPQPATPQSVTFVEKPITLGYIIDNIDSSQLVSWIGIVLMVFFTLFAILYLIWTGYDTNRIRSLGVY